MVTSETVELNINYFIKIFSCLELSSSVSSTLRTSIQFLVSETAVWCTDIAFCNKFILNKMFVSKHKTQ